MADNGSTVSGTLREIRFHKDSYLIGLLDGGVGVKGSMLSPQIGMEYELKGRWQHHPRWGDTFIFSEYRASYPKDVDAIGAYLIENCKWIGPEVSKRLIEAYGEDVLDVCKADPEKVAKDIRGITKKRAKEISAMLKNNEANEQLQIEMGKLVAGTSVSKRAVNSIIQKYGQSAPEAIKKNPYRLIDDIDGVGFLSADRVAAKVGFKREGAPRITAGIAHVLKEAAFGDGHTCLPTPELISRTEEILQVKEKKVSTVLKRMIKRKQVIEWEENIYLPSSYEEERLVAEKLKALASKDVDAGTPELGGLQEDQIEAMHEAMGSAVFILTGAPGTGKTYTIKKIIESFPDARIVLAAPSGKAAKRMYEQSGRKAQTIHKLLEPQKVGAKFVFTRDSENPIHADIIVLDEVSMIDNSLMASFLDALSPDTRLIMVGDIYQLPSVGPGNVLKDLIASGVIPCVELSIIKRQDEGLIITNCHRIKDGKDIKVKDSKSEDFFLMRRETPEEIRDAIVDLLTNRLEKTYDIDLLRDVQVMSPLREKTILSCKGLNEVCQKQLNSNASVNGCPFRVGDKVIQTKNQYELEIINGDIGYVRSINREERTIYVDFENPSRSVQIPLQNNNLQLAYAITVHKFQGSEAPIIIIPVHRCFGTLITQRNLLYTAVSRAQKVCILVGQREEIHKMIRRNKQQRRFTNLARFLCEEEK